MTNYSHFYDCDPGHDDAFMLLLAAYHPSIKILGVTTVAGNQTVQKTAKNAKRLLTLIGRPDVEVIAGSERPIVASLRICDEIHGQSGLDVIGKPNAWDSVDALIAQEFQPEPFRAISFMYNSIKEAKQRGETVHLIATGSLTNVALAVRVFPDLIDLVDKFLIMGGSIGMGNIATKAEFNILVDPEAAEICVNAFAGKMYMVPLEVTHTAIVTEEVLVNIKKELSPQFYEMIQGLLLFFDKTYRDVFGFSQGPPLHDPCALFLALHPEYFEGQFYHVDIELRGALTAGATCVDFFNLSGLEKNVFVTTKMNVDKFWEAMVVAMKRADENKVI
ncbi:hypothetical protein RCL1_000407 [Eukaryota sp. TZLM3-RCL]